MIKTAGALLAAAILAGCGHAQEDTAEAETTPLPGPVTYAGASGMGLYYDASIPESDRFPDWYEAHYQATAKCMGAQAAPGPSVHVVAHNGENDGGRVTFADGGVSVWGYSCVRHEFVHYLLWRDGFPNGPNGEHNHPAFAACGGACL